MAICSDLTEEEALCALKLHKDRCDVAAGNFPRHAQAHAEEQRLVSKLTSLCCKGNFGSWRGLRRPCHQGHSVKFTRNALTHKRLLIRPEQI